LLVLRETASEGSRSLAVLVVRALTTGVSRALALLAVRAAIAGVSRSLTVLVVRETAKGNSRALAVLVVNETTTGGSGFPVVLVVTETTFAGFRVLTVLLFRKSTSGVLSWALTVLVVEITSRGSKVLVVLFVKDTISRESRALVVLFVDDSAPHGPSALSAATCSEEFTPLSAEDATSNLSPPPFCCLDALESRGLNVGTKDTASGASESMELTTLGGDSTASRGSEASCAFEVVRSVLTEVETSCLSEILILLGTTVCRTSLELLFFEEPSAVLLRAFVRSGKEVVVVEDTASVLL
jgi:hypothetical protein